MAKREPPKMKLVKVVGELTPAHKQFYVGCVVRHIERLMREEQQALMQQHGRTESHGLE